MILKMCLLSSSVSLDIAWVNQYACYQEPETEAAKRESAIPHFIIYTCAIPSVLKGLIVQQSRYFSYQLDWKTA